jgi:hypothetical protein
LLQINPRSHRDELLAAVDLTRVNAGTARLGIITLGCPLRAACVAAAAAA